MGNEPLKSIWFVSAEQSFPRGFFEQRQRKNLTPRDREEGCKNAFARGA